MTTPDDLSGQLHKAFDDTLDAALPDDLLRLARRVERVAAPAEPDADDGKEY
ncbi:MAG TPA: hypothetical protein VFO41_13765 [Alphaproteobacteria bacterium]|nr:hypothetical protein [Alphaproteobacteria bacterium]